MSYTPDQAREILTEFVELDKVSPVLEDYGELQSVISSDVRLALSSLVLQTGRPPRHSQDTTLGVLENKHGLTKVQGIVHNEYGHLDPVAIQLGKYKWPYRYGVCRTQYAFMRIDEDRPFVSADDGVFSYTPGFAEQEAVSGDRARASSMLTGYLWTVLSLTNELVRT